ncbi:MAG: inositol monophosphatase, partial [Pseudomonadota bacterium]
MSLDADLRNALIDATRAAARREILPRFRSLAPDQIHQKTGVQDLVTEADLATEAALREAFARVMPGAAIIGEEGMSQDASELDRLEGTAPVIVIDPIDGTWNFAHGLATFGTIIAVVEGGQTIFGLLYDPVCDDWIWTGRGQGTWFGGADRGDAALPPLAPPPLDQMTGLHSGHGLTPEQRVAATHVYGLVSQVGSPRASLWDYRLLATGAAGFSMNRMLNVWDHAAGVLAFTELGGQSALLDGRPYAPTLRSGMLL